MERRVLWSVNDLGSPVNVLEHQVNQTCSSSHFVMLLPLQFYSLHPKSSLHPRISAAIIMESAIITSKIDPETLEPGKWRIPTGEAAEPISRLRK